jgi:CDP-diglyceride synthetase
MSLVVIHGIISRAFLYFAIIIALWTLIQYVRKQEIGGNYWGAVVIGEVLVVLQAIVGVVLWFQGALPARPIHFLYGIVAVLTWPGVFAATKGETGRRETLYWLVASIFLAGIAFRAISTGMS